MLAKLSWEIAQFERTMSRQQDQLGAILFAGYQAFNCAVTAWHCADWSWEYADDDMKKGIADRFTFELKKRNKPNREAFFDAVCAECREIEICRHIANSSKHLKLDPSRDQGFRALAAYAASPSQPERLVFELLIIDREQPRRALEVFSQALKYWQRLFGDLGYIEDTFVDGLRKTEPK